MTPAERYLRRVVELAGDLADQIRDQPPPPPAEHAAAMDAVASQIVECAQWAAANLRTAAGGHR